MSDASSTLEAAAVVEEPRAISLPVEAIMDSHRLRGELQGGALPRRLVDILNSGDGSYLSILNGRLDDPFKPDDSPRELAAIQLLRDAVLFMMPAAARSPLTPFEVVKKISAHASIVVPGFRISGSIYLMPDADPATVPLIGTHHFVPITDATVTAARGRSEIWQEPIVLINMTRALLYGPI